MTAFAPCCAAPIAMARPIPLEAPVTTTTLPFRISLIVVSRCGPRLFVGDSRARTSTDALRVPLVRRDGAELLHQREEIRYTPMLGDLAIVHPHGVDSIEMDLPACRCDPQ